MNGDGVPDLLLLQGGFDNGSMSNVGRIRARSVISTQTLWTWTGTVSNSGLGSSIDGGRDVNGDGRCDVVVGAWFHLSPARIPIGRVYVISGATGQTLWIAEGQQPFEQLGWTVRLVPDYNGDGLADVAAAAKGYESITPYSPSVIRIYSGLDGSVIRTTEPHHPGEFFGQDFDVLEDTNGDGVPELLVGAPRLVDEISGNSGAVFVIDGATGRSVAKMFGEQLGSGFGHSLGVLDDLDGDGWKDFAVGSPQFFSDGLVLCGKVDAFSGRSMKLLWARPGRQFEGYFGHALAAAGDTNGDGFDDVVVGGYLQGYACIISGATGLIIDEWSGEKSGAFYGIGVAGLGDVNNDGLADVTVGAPDQNTPTLINAGRQYIYYGSSECDLDCNRLVNVSDLLRLINAWGECPSDGSCWADFGGDGMVAVNDLLHLITNWSLVP